MAEKKYVAVNPEDGISNEMVRMLNPNNEFRGLLMSYNQYDKTDVLDVRELFLAHVKVDGRFIQAYTDNARRIVDISPHVELNPVAVDGSAPEFTEWDCMPPRTREGEPTDENPYPDKRISMRLRDDGKWVVVLVLQEADPEQGIEEVTKDITQGKGGISSLALKWADAEIDYGDLVSVTAERGCPNLLGYRLGVEDGLNEGKLLQPAADEASDEPFFRAWKNGYHQDGLCAGQGATAYIYDYEQGKRIKVEGGVAFGTNARVTAENAVQIGAGTNAISNTFNFREWQLLNAEGHIPNERLVTDDTLEVIGAAADSYAVGQAIRNLTLNPGWRTNPETFNTHPITIEVREQGGVKSYVPVANGQVIGVPKQIPDGDSKIVWESDWEGGYEPLVARLYYILADKDQQKVQPAGDYLVADDLSEVEVNQFIAEKILVKYGGSIEMGQDSFIKIQKRFDEPYILVESDDGDNQLRFPAKTGTLAIEEDIPTVLPMMIPLTWDELVELRENGELEPGMQYRIMDYVATTNGNNSSQSANHPFDIIVVADDAHTLNEVARAALPSDGDEYFINSNVTAWKVWYCIDNDPNRFAWADEENGKGVVYKLIDEFGNEAPYDFKGLRFKAFGDSDEVWRYTFDSGDTHLSEIWNFVNLDNANEVYEWQGVNQEGEYTWTYNNGARTITYVPGLRVGTWYLDGISSGRMTSDETELYAGNIMFANAKGTLSVKRVEVWGRVAAEPTTVGPVDLSLRGTENGVYGNVINPYFVNGARSLNRIVFKGKNCYGNHFGVGCRDNTFGDVLTESEQGTCKDNVFEGSNWEITGKQKCSFNHFGHECQGVTFGYNCNLNVFGNHTQCLRFGNACKNNTIGPDCNSITLGYLCSNNKFGNGCSAIAGGNYIAFCTFGNGLLNVVFGGQTSDTWESGFQYIEIGNSNMRLSLKCSANRDNPSKQLVKYITFRDSVSGMVSPKNIVVSSYEQTHHTTYQMAGEETISI